MKKLLNRDKTLTFLLIIAFIIPLILIINKTTQLDNDIWYLLAEGRYIVQNGVYNVDPLSIHEGLQTTVQNWGAASFLWIIYSNFGEIGIFSLILICNFLVCLLLYKISMLISDNHKFLSIGVVFATDYLLLFPYMVSRPQIFSFVSVLSLIYVLELYAKYQDKKYLYWLPIISFIQVNMHASLWCMIFAIILTYIIDSLNIKFLHTEKYNTKPLLIATIISFLIGIINPYGIKAITFIFGSYTELAAKGYVMELMPFQFTDSLARILFYVILGCGAIYALYRNGNVRIRYICLFCGCMILGFSTVKAFNIFILVSLFHLAYFFKDIFPRKLPKLINKFNKIVNVLLIVIIIVDSLILLKYISNLDNSVLGANPAKNAMDAIGTKVSRKDAIIFAGYNDGGYVEFRGYKSYLDPRGEVFLKSNNKKFDVLFEEEQVYKEEITIQEFLDKYNFTHLLIQPNHFLYQITNSSHNYFIVYEDPNNGFRLYARNDLYSDEERESYIKSYSFKNGGDTN